MPKIASGIVRFKTEVYPQKKELFDQLVKGQHPEALFITCSDSRIDPNLLVQTEPGELFICRNAGNIVPPHSNYTGGTTATIEYAVAVLEVKHIIVCGHTCCGAMAGVMDPDSLTNLPHVTQWLSYSKAAHQIVMEKLPEGSHDERLAMLIDENVLLQLQHLKTHPHVAAKLSTNKIQLHAWTYDIGAGDVRAFDDERGEFVPVEERYAEDVKAYLESQQAGACNADH
ncbi:carbonic anhydrase [Oleiphilus sp. HI0078]|jgi:carbonic anhydrase|uniref:carbonic anhydrase n=1 Tax=unclassified Oleiphilus TaxID=2631174 RepID=UPI0007C27218|nr:MULTISPECIES: carbonic anhydrase [unclassified Oleiphilus]KZY76817.1 carbonic anhydrase [Oleiphilus sp. HI0068]KZY85630.1 carbonic anhydrase [Oleiphilus sp. HI0069]KZY87891.1 carbonic anhydrase [Oleiphilus sp. HI0072]KZZ06778.1 carbonic anhydrase [Oleiphilus sp. HI0078]KZZ45337.1 carbonic anhydrase [Oleiphilus sp. HI0085]